MYIKETQNGLLYPFSFASLRADNPQVSFPSVPSDVLLAEYGVYSVLEVAQPEYDSSTHYVVEATPEKIGQNYSQKWTIEPIQVVVPTVVPMRQARLALLAAGLLDVVEEAIASSTNRAWKIEWEYATEVRRDWPLLVNIQAALGLTDEQVDDLFNLASTL